MIVNDLPGRPSRHRHRRPGVMLLEMTVSVIFLGVALALVARLMVNLGAADRAADHRQWALCEAENVLERALSLSWDDLTAGDATNVLIQEATARASRALPEGRVVVSIGEPDDEPGARRVTVEVAWGHPSGRP